MSDQDVIEQAVRDVLRKEGPELQRQKRIADQRAELDQYAKEQSAPAERRESSVDATNGPVRYEDVVIPTQVQFFNDPVPSQGNGPSAPVSVTTVSTRICLADGTVAVKNVVVQ